MVTYCCVHYCVGAEHSMDLEQALASVACTIVPRALCICEQLNKATTRQ